MRSSALLLRFLLIPTVVAYCASGAHAQEPSIDRLLAKLPPPEKFKRPPLERALEQEDPALDDPMVNNIASAARSGSYKRAMDATRKLIARHPHSPGAYCLMGALAFLARQYGEASANFRRALAERPRYSLAYYGLAAVELDQNHFAAAIPPLQQFVNLEPQNTNAWLILCDCAHHLGRKEDSANYARRATATAPSSAITWLHLARAERALGHAQQTIAAVARAADLTPDNAEMLAIIGFSYINLNRIAEAIPPLERAARERPRDYLIQSQLGYCLGKVGRTNEAITRLRIGATLKPTYGPVWYHLGLVYQKLGRRDEAIKAFEKAARLMPQSPLPKKRLSEEYAGMGRAPQVSHQAVAPAKVKRR